MKTYRHIDTKLIHAGEPRPRIGGAVTTPIFQSAMFEYSGETSYHDLKYIRLNNTPNHQVLDTKLAALEGGEAGLVTASGMAAMNFLDVLKTLREVGLVALAGDPGRERVELTPNGRQVAQLGG